MSESGHQRRFAAEPPKARCWGYSGNRSPKSGRRRANVCCRGKSGGSRAMVDSVDPSHKRTLAFPNELEHWSLTMLREKLIEIGAKIVRHDRYVTFQMA